MGGPICRHSNFGRDRGEPSAARDVPAASHVGHHLSCGNRMQSFIFEIVLTLVLMFVILSVSTGAKEKAITAGIAIGSIIGLEALFAGPISGASMNPARSLAPALVSFQLESLWLYLTAPVLGAVAAVFACLCVREKPCCCSPLNEGCA